MSRLIPPRKTFALGYESEGVRRVRFRIWQILMAGITLILSAWFCSFGVLPAIITLLVAKHVLVAIFVAGLHVPRGPERESPLPEESKV